MRPHGLELTFFPQFLRRQSSFLGHPRETAETIQADHLSMCRFHSADNTGYRALVNTLARFIHSEASRRNTISDRELGIGYPSLENGKLIC